MSEAIPPEPTLGRVLGKKPSARQIYALAAALCERQGEEFPKTLAAASALLERVRTEIGHPAPRLEDTPLRPRTRRRRRRGGSFVYLSESDVAELLASSIGNREPAGALGYARPQPGIESERRHGNRGQRV